MWPWGAVAAFTCICVRVSYGITESCVFSVQCTISRCIRILRLTQSQTTPNLPPSPACGKCAILKIVNYALGRSVGKWSKSKTLNSGTLILADELMRKERGKLRLWALFQLQVWINPKKYYQWKAQKLQSRLLIRLSLPKESVEEVKLLHP